MRVTWYPRDMPAWSYGDSWSNEFSTAAGRELTDAEFEAYLDWSYLEQRGRIAGFADNEFLVIALDVPGVGGIERVYYPTAVLEQLAD